MVGMVVLALVPLVVVELEPMRGQQSVGQSSCDMVVDMVLVVVVVGEGGFYGGQCVDDE